MKPITLLTATLLSSALLMANPYENKQEAMDDAIKTGHDASMLLMKTLGGNLKTKMQNEGVMGAAEFCTTQAQVLTADVNSKLDKGVSVRRVSLQTRNPNNAPSKTDTAVLEALEILQKNNVDLPPYLIQYSYPETYTYYQPLQINKPVCLKCHGDISKDKALSSFMKEHYPHDKATGYKMGDLRGVIVVEMKK